MTLPEEDENILFSTRVDASLVPLPRATPGEALDEAALLSLSELLGVRDIRDDEEVSAVIWDAYDRLHTQFARASPASSSSSSSSSASSSASYSASPSPSPSSYSSSVSCSSPLPATTVSPTTAHAFCDPAFVQDGFRVLYSFAFESDDPARAQQAAVVLRALSASLLRCSACVAAYAAGCRLFLACILRDRGAAAAACAPGDAPPPAPSLAQDEEEPHVLCARLQKKILAWDLLRILPVLARARARLSAGGRVIDLLDSEERARDKALPSFRERHLRSLLKSHGGHAAASDSPSARPPQPVLTPGQRGASSSISSPPRSSAPCVSLASTGPRPTDSSFSDPRACALLTALLDSSRLLYADFSFPLETAQEDLRDFGASLPTLLVDLLPRSPRARGDRRGDGEGGGAAHAATAEERGAREREAALQSSARSSAFFSPKGLAAETLEQLAAHQRTLQSLLRIHPAFADSGTSAPLASGAAGAASLFASPRASSALLEFSEEALAAAGASPATSLPPAVLLLRVLPGPLACLEPVLAALLRHPAAVAHLLLSFQTHAFPSLRLVACAALHLAALCRPALLGPACTAAATAVSPLAGLLSVVQLWTMLLHILARRLHQGVQGMAVRGGGGDLSSSAHAQRDGEESVRSTLHHLLLILRACHALFIVRAPATGGGGALTAAGIGAVVARDLFARLSPGEGEASSRAPQGLQHEQDDGKNNAERNERAGGGGEKTRRESDAAAARCLGSLTAVVEAELSGSAYDEATCLAAGLQAEVARRRGDERQGDREGGGQTLDANREREPAEAEADGADEDRRREGQACSVELLLGVEPSVPALGILLRALHVLARRFVQLWTLLQRLSPVPGDPRHPLGAEAERAGADAKTPRAAEPGRRSGGEREDSAETCAERRGEGDEPRKEAAHEIRRTHTGEKSWRLALPLEAAVVVLEAWETSFRELRSLEILVLRALLVVLSLLHKVLLSPAAAALFRDASSFAPSRPPSPCTSSLSSPASFSPHSSAASPAPHTRLGWCWLLRDAARGAQRRRRQLSATCAQLGAEAREPRLACAECPLARLQGDAGLPETSTRLQPSAGADEAEPRAAERRKGGAEGAGGGVQAYAENEEQRRLEERFLGGAAWACETIAGLSEELEQLLGGDGLAAESNMADGGSSGEVEPLAAADVNEGCASETREPRKAHAEGVIAPPAERSSDEEGNAKEVARLRSEILGGDERFHQQLRGEPQALSGGLSAADSWKDADLEVICVSSDSDVESLDAEKPRRADAAFSALALSSPSGDEAETQLSPWTPDEAQAGDAELAAGDARPRDRKAAGIRGSRGESASSAFASPLESLSDEEETFERARPAGARAPAPRPDRGEANWGDGACRRDAEDEARDAAPSPHAVVEVILSDDDDEGGSEQEEKTARRAGGSPRRDRGVSLRAGDDGGARTADSERQKETEGVEGGRSAAAEESGGSRLSSRCMPPPETRQKDAGVASSRTVCCASPPSTSSASVSSSSGSSESLFSSESSGSSLPSSPSPSPSPSPLPSPSSVAGSPFGPASHSPPASRDVGRLSKPSVFGPARASLSLPPARPAASARGAQPQPMLATGSGAAHAGEQKNSSLSAPRSSPDMAKVGLGTANGARGSPFSSLFPSPGSAAASSARAAASAPQRGEDVAALWATAAAAEMLHRKARDERVACEALCDMKRRQEEAVREKQRAAKASGAAAPRMETAAEARFPPLGLTSGKPGVYLPAAAAQKGREAFEMVVAEGEATKRARPDCQEPGSSGAPGLQGKAGAQDREERASSSSRLAFRSDLRSSSVPERRPASGAPSRGPSALPAHLAASSSLPSVLAAAAVQAAETRQRARRLLQARLDGALPPSRRDWQTKGAARGGGGLCGLLRTHGGRAADRASASSLGFAASPALPAGGFAPKSRLKEVAGRIGFDGPVVRYRERREATHTGPADCCAAEEGAPDDGDKQGERESLRREEEEKQRAESRKAEQIRRMRMELERGQEKEAAAPDAAAAPKRHTCLAPSSGLRRSFLRGRKPVGMPAETWSREQLKDWVRREVEEDARLRRDREEEVRRAERRRREEEEAQRKQLQEQEEARQRKKALERARVVVDADAAVDQFLWRLLHVDVFGLASGDEDAVLQRENARASSGKSSPRTPSPPAAPPAASADGANGVCRESPETGKVAGEGGASQGACTRQTPKFGSPASAQSPQQAGRGNLVAPLLFLELLHQLKQAFSDQPLEPRMCVLEELRREGPQWTLGRLAMARLCPQLAAFARATCSRSRGAGSRQRSFFNEAWPDRDARGRGDEPRAEREDGDRGNGFFPNFGVHELLLLLPVGSAYTRLLRSPEDLRGGGSAGGLQGAGDCERPEKSASSSASQTGEKSGASPSDDRDDRDDREALATETASTLEHALEVMRRYAGRTFADVAKEELRSWFLLGIVERVEEASLAGFSATAGGREKAGGGQLVLRLPQLVNWDLADPRAAPRHGMKRVPLHHVALNTSWVAISLTQLTTAVREVQAVFLSELSPRFSFLLNPTAPQSSAQSAAPQSSAQSAAPLLPPLSSLSSLSSASVRAASAASARSPALATAWFKQAVDRQLKSELLNASQAAAVRDVLTSETKLGLIQGPPGTGKTKTILALLSVLYGRLRDNQGARAGPSATVASPPAGLGSACREGVKKKILICAPSNAAVDEIAERVLTHGLFHPMTGEKLAPTCLRIGNVDRVRESVQSIALDVQVKRLRGLQESQLETSFQASLQELREKKKALIQQHQCVRFLSSRATSLDPARLHSAEYLDELVKAMLASPSFSSFFLSEPKDRGEETIRELLPPLARLGLYGLKDMRSTLDAQLEDVNASLARLFETRRQERPGLLPVCRQQVILSADIIFATLSSSASECLCPYTLATAGAAGNSGAPLRGASPARLLTSTVAPSLFSSLSGAFASPAGSAALLGAGAGARLTKDQKIAILQAQFCAQQPPFSYAYLIVDEAGQASELSCLIPLRLAPERCILVGDPQQLPSTVFSSLAEKRGLGRSLLERLMICIEEEKLLQTAERRAKEARADVEKASAAAQSDKERRRDARGGAETQGDADARDAQTEQEASTRKANRERTEPESDEEERKRKLVQGGVSLALDGKATTERPALKINLLATQYRMREAIARFPADAFYEGRLKTSASVALRPELPCFRLHWLFAPLKFFHVPSLEDRCRRGASGSLVNYEEARFVISLLRTLYVHFCQKTAQAAAAGAASPSPAHKLSDVSIITPYRQQVALLQQLLAEDSVLRAAPQKPEINTVDAFQGREKAIVIISFVRAASPAALAALAGTPEAEVRAETCKARPHAEAKDAPPARASSNGEPEAKKPRIFPPPVIWDLPAPMPASASAASSASVAPPTAQASSGLGSFATLGFVSDFRRLNVALTRARDALWIVGDGETLQTHPMFRRLLAFIQGLPGDAYIDVRRPPERLRQAMAAREARARSHDEGLLERFISAATADFMQLKAHMSAYKSIIFED
ncbi:hypothetical protein BESB_009720 [Besnoitia besnoiti]|uniref:Uncharacterized protein n=1 Tax=Besnoitia besnoiti TaxID=94643 RepID=A0A2A9MQY3_BESBE|nr:hypothetical protein BESB_009720 [Besnoitia besnoiti]PFH38630.1 hypothetical protein BESB_009720 [Besnoitia besnoiti]